MAISPADSGISPRQTLFGCVIPADPSHSYQALRCVQSLRWLGGTCSRSDFLVAVGGRLDPAMRDSLLSYGVRLWEDARAEATGAAPKTLVLEFARLHAYELAVAVDPNTLILRDPRPYLDFERIAAAAIDMELMPSDDIRGWYARFGLNVPTAPAETAIDRRRVPACFSAGVVTVPRTMLERIGPLWRAYACRLEELTQEVQAQIKYPSALLAKSASSWLGFTLAVARSGAPSCYLPVEMDCPAFYFCKVPQFDPDPVICRYMPEPAGAAPGCWIHHYHPQLDSRIQRGIDRFNTRLYEHCLSAGDDLQFGRLAAEPLGFERATARSVIKAADGPADSPPDAGPRIAVVATPRCGNNWLTQLLAKIYDLPILPSGDDWRVLERTSGDRFVFYSHLEPNGAVLRWAQQHDVALVTLTRSLSDVFLSLYELVNALDRAKLAPEITEQPLYRKLIGRPLDAEEVFDFLSRDFGEPRNSILWVLSGKALVVRYEDLHQDTEATLTDLCNRICPVPAQRIRDAVEACDKDKMRRKNRALEVIVRRGMVGEGAQRLSPRHLQCIRQRYADELALLGYSH